MMKRRAEAHSVVTKGEGRRFGSRKERLRLEHGGCCCVGGPSCYTRYKRIRIVT
jgi:hypothetical protein